MKQKAVFFLACISISLLYVYLAFYNGYPIVTSDSGAYIGTGFDLYWPADRPITYSLFIRLFSLGISLWIPIVVQGALLTFLTYRLSRVLFTNQYYQNILFYIVSVSVISFTCVSWYSSQLMSDVFTPILILSIVLYFLDDLKQGKYVYPILIFSSTVTHNSNLIALFLFSLVVIIRTYLQKKKFLKREVHVLMISLAAISIFITMSLLRGDGFTISRSSHVFLMGKLCENGVLKSYLNDHCDEQEYQMCNYTEELPYVAWEFVWNQQSPLYQMGGWQETKSEYNQLLFGIATSPKHLFMLLYKSVEHAIRQLFQIQVGDGIHAYRESSPPFHKVQVHFQHELPEYMSSKQNQSTLEVDQYNALYFIFLIVSTIVLLVIIAKYGAPPGLYYVYFLCLSFVIINAFVTANFANVLGRLSSRTIWILPMLHIIYIVRHWAVHYLGNHKEAT